MVTLKDGTKVKVALGLKDYERVEVISGIKAEDELIVPVK
jgi:hypothetical protein